MGDTPGRESRRLQGSLFKGALLDTLNRGGIQDLIMSHPMGRVAKKSGILGCKQVGDKLWNVQAPCTPGPSKGSCCQGSSWPAFPNLHVPGSRPPFATPGPGSQGVNRCPDPRYILGKLPTNARSTTSEEKLSSEGFTLASYAHLTPLLTLLHEKNKSTSPIQQVTTYPSPSWGSTQIIITKTTS